jgi:tripartite-type tricarboxylate transporter receptor subunit TctC
MGFNKRKMEDQRRYLAEKGGPSAPSAPKSTSTAIIEKLNNEIKVIMTEPNMRAHLFDLGVEPVSMTPAEFGKRIADDTEKWAKVVKFAGIKPE